MRLEIGKFRKWLRSKKPDEVVGRARSPSCPIRNFHQEVGGCDVVIFETGDGYRIDRGDGGRAVPYWTSKFIFEVDDQVAPFITAEQALKFLSY